MSIDTKVLITKNHHRLLRFSTIFNILALIALIAFSIPCFGLLLQIFTDDNFFQNFGFPDSNNSFRIFVGLLNTLFQLLIYAVVLRSISLALTQIVETDINYRMKAQEEDHE